MSSRNARTALSVVAAAVTVFGLTSTAHAFEAKHTASGKPVHWAQSQVDFTMSPALDAAGDGAQDAVVRALAGWAGAADAPTLTATAGDDIAPANDGRNVITYMPEGYPGAGGALAITVLTYDDDSGVIFDCDIVVNGHYNFALFDDATRAGAGVIAISTEGGGAVRSGVTFDLVHVIAHEAGHAMGLSDEPGDATALMYPFTTPSDASSRLPESDDVAGIAALYTQSVQKGSDAPGGLPGCSVGAASLGQSHGAGGGASFLLAASLVLVPILRRRTRTRA